MEKWKLQEITYKEVKKNKYEVAVLPVGSTEPHGFHLPYGSDFFQSQRIAELICEQADKKKAKVILLPCIPYGVNTNTLKLPLVISLRPSVLGKLIIEIIDSLEHHGIRKLIILNGHGGNEFGSLLREIHGRTKVFVCAIDWWKVGEDLAEKIFSKKGEHADEFETSVNLVINPHLVHLKWAGDGKVNKTRFEAINKGWVKITRPWHLFTKDTGAGNPKNATREKGEKIIRLVVERISSFVKELSDSPLDEKFPYVVK